MSDTRVRPRGFPPNPDGYTPVVSLDEIKSYLRIDQLDEDDKLQFFERVARARTEGQLLYAIGGPDPDTGEPTPITDDDRNAVLVYIEYLYDNPDGQADIPQAFFDLTWNNRQFEFY